ncbi:MAG: N-6 DNA methylase [Sandaracinaceae bacterium]|nr:N-6 DNA methylase [Sandaracinaceae bacterium]
MVAAEGEHVTSIKELAARIASRDSPRTEATLQADIRQLLLDHRLGLTDDVLLEPQAGEGRRIDVEVGSTVIEVKKDLRNPAVLRDAVKQLRGYVRAREAASDRRYVGVLTDGAEWRCYHLRQDELHETGSMLTVSPTKPDVDTLLIWLEGVLATARDIKPTPEEIYARLGVGSSSHSLDRASLADLYEQHRDDPVVRTKRLLWARLLETALGTQFQDSDDLFVEHTLLVNTAEIIAHAVLGLSPEHLAPRSLLSGAKFDEAGVHGVVESDFFDWVVDVPKGDSFVRTLARRIARFDWRAVEHDVLKVLYESVISAETRKKLGEYYTPDWLAQKVVETAVPAPLTTRALDPSCGSGTFLFHMVRRYLAAGEKAGHTMAQQLDGVTRNVVGMDLHPVAVTLARVTYLLAIGPERLAAERNPLRVPVFLGDSMQWRNARSSLWSAHELRVPVNDQRELTESEFVFPQSLLADPAAFDELVSQLADRASKGRKHGAKPSLNALFLNLAIPEDARKAITATFHLMCRLHDEGRDHIWGYYIRNLARPEWLARPENHVDVLVGNPPWLAFRHMPEDMQADFRSMSEARGLWHGRKYATQQDLSALFVVRALELYLRREGGRFAFVMPSAVLDRGQYEGFRSGTYAGAQDQLNLQVALDPPWDLRKIRPHFFPISASVVFGSRSKTASPMPEAGERWVGKLQKTNATWSAVERFIQREASHTERGEAEVRSPYHPRFRNGATILTRVLFMVQPVSAGPLGQVRNRISVRTARSATEKAPWKSIPSREAVVESEFVFRVHLGETVLPFRALEPMQAVLPIERRGILEESKIEGYPALANWWAESSQLWEAHRSSARLTLMQQLYYHGKLRGQLPVPPERVVYAKAGMHLAAARLSDPRAIIDHKLYWAAITTPEEGQYLCAILNAVVVTERVRPLMSYGKDERDIDKYVWSLPIPMFDPTNPLHQRIAGLGRDAEEFVAQVGIGTQHFASQRRLVRDLLAESNVGRAIEQAVTQLLDAPSASHVALPDPTEANITALLEAGRTTEARALAAGTRWEAVLAPPVTKVAETASATGDLPANLHWVAENATAYRAKWVALKAGSLVASGSSLDALKQELQSRVDHAELTLMQVPT